MIRILRRRKMIAQRMELLRAEYQSAESVNSSEKNTPENRS